MSKNKRKGGHTQSESEGLANQPEKPQASADVSYGTFQAPQVEAGGRENVNQNNERKSRRLAKFVK